MEPEQGLALIEQVGQKIHGGTCRVLTSADLLAFQPTEFHDGTQTPDTIACVRAQTSRAQPLTTIIILRAGETQCSSTVELFIGLLAFNRSELRRNHCARKRNMQPIASLQSSTLELLTSI